MNNKIITYTAEPAATRWTYFKTALILFVATQVMNLFAQWRLVQQVEWKYSFIVCTIISLLISYGLSRSPLTKSLAIDYVKRCVVVSYATLTSSNKSLEIPFERLGIRTDAPSDAAISTKWRTWLQLDGKDSYLLLSSESGFGEEKMVEFNEQLKTITRDQGTATFDEKEHA